jgi:hypothetical protein
MNAKHLPFRMASVVSMAIWCALGALAQGTGSIAGVLRDANGMPLAGVRVTAVLPGGGRPSSATTDVAGLYRIANLAPGTYTIAAGTASRATYYPGRTVVAEAIALTVGSGTNVVGIDFTMMTAPGATVKGRVIQPPSNAALGLTAMISPTMRTEVKTDGTFEFKDVPAGAYTVQFLGRGGALLIGGSGAPRSTQVPLTVEDDVTLADFTLPAFFEVRGRILVDGEAGLPPELELIQAQAKSVNATRNAPRGATFTLILPAGSYEMGVTPLPMNYSLESISSGDRELRSTPLTLNSPMTSDLVIRLAAFPPKSAKAPVVRGKVTNLPPASFIQDPKVRLTRDPRAGGGAVESPVGADGAFEFSKVPAGLYAVSTQGLSSSFTSTLTVGDADIPDMSIALAGIANPFPGYVVGASLFGLFNTSTQITLQGTLTEPFTQIRPPAPVGYLRMEVRDPVTGVSKNWGILISGPGNRTYANLPDAEKLKVGTRITVHGYPSRDGTNGAALVPIPNANSPLGLNVD